MEEHFSEIRFYRFPGIWSTTRCLVSIRPPNNLCYVEYIRDIVKHPIFPAIYYNGGMHKYNIVSLLGHSRESTTMLLLMITMIRRIMILLRR